MIGIALALWAVLAHNAFLKYLEAKMPKPPEVNITEDMIADINRIKLMLNMKTFIGGDKK